MQTPDSVIRWERRKRHLLRNFLVNPGSRLSAVPEECSSPLSDDGSLPDLLLEPAPDRHRHDHPPDFYESLERRMKRYYRQLFLGARSDDDDSSDFEVNRSMASTFMIDTNTRKDTEAKIVAESAGFYWNHSISKKRQSTKSTNEFDEDDASENQNKYDDKLIDTCATYNDTGHVSVDSKSSSLEDEDNLILTEYRSINESNHSNETEDDRNVNIEANGNNQSYEIKDDDQGSTDGDKLNRSETLNEIEESSKFIETKSDSEEVPCHRVSTTVAEVHERRARDSTHVFDNGSPVLITRLLQFKRSVFGSRRISGQSFNVSEASDEFIRRLSSHKSDVSNKQEEPETEVERLLTASELTRASIDSDNSNTEKVIESTEDKTQGNDVHKNDDIQDKIQLSEIQTDNEEDRSKLDADEDDETEITGIQSTTIDWNKDGIDNDEDCFDNALRRGEFTSKARKMVFISSSEESFDDLEPLAQSSAISIDEVEVMREARGGGVNESWQGEVVQDSPALAFEGQTDADKLENESSVSTEINASFEHASEDPPNTNTQNLEAIAKITDDFWSVSPMDDDVEELKESRGAKRRIDSEGDATKRRKQDVAIQTGLEENKKWEDIRTDFLVGTPLVFRLCGCLDHVCS